MTGIRRDTGLRALGMAALLAASTFGSAKAGRAQEGTEPVVLAQADDLKNLSIEELMQIDVTSVSRRSQPVCSAAAAVVVITAEEIRRSGANSLPEALRLVNSLHVAQVTQRVWAISARGFNQGGTANKLLVLIDGRSVYTPLFSGVYWDVQDVLLEDVDRIEVIRGPGATLWGANAVNGVINIITKRAENTQGGLVLAGGGQEERGFAGARWGGSLGERGHFRVYGKYADRDSLALVRGGDPEDDQSLGQGGFRADWKTAGGDAVTLQSDAYVGTVGELGRGESDVDGGNLLGRWSRRFSERSGLEVQAYWDRSHRFIPTLFEEHRDTWDLDLQQDFRLGDRHQVIWGLGYRHTRDRVGNSADLAFLPAKRAQDLFSGFAQDEISLLSDRLRVTVGAKLEHHDSTGVEVQPNVRFSLALSDRRTLWGAVSRAVRTPTRLDEDVIFFSPATGAEVVRGSRDFESEDLIAYELGYRFQPRPEISVDTAAFFNIYDNLRSQELQPNGGRPVVLGNRSNAEAWGLETRVHWQPVAWWRWQLGYAWLDHEFSLDPGSRDPVRGRAEADDPPHRFMVRSYLDLPGGVELDAWLRYVDELVFSRTPGYTELNLHLGWRPTRSVELALIGQNLLHDDHVEFGGPASLNREAVERALYGKVTWSF